MNADPGLPFAADTPQAPWNQPQLDPREQREIARKADELAGDCFDRWQDEARNWLRELDSVDLLDLTFAAIKNQRLPNDDEASLSLSAEVDKLREKFVSESAQLFRAEAEREIMETADED